MKQIWIILLLGFIVGCQPPNSVQPQAIPSPASPPSSEQPSTSYLLGYNDGYFGNWLAPVRWVAADEYRHGWSAGNWDRRHNLPHRYNND